jgi:hypothetical protein
LNGRKDGYENSSFGAANNFPVLIKQNKVEPPPIRLRKIGAPPPVPAPGVTPPPPTAPVSGAQFARLANTENATRSVNFDAKVLLALPIPGLEPSTHWHCLRLGSHRHQQPSAEAWDPDLVRVWDVRAILSKRAEKPRE